MRKFTFIEFVGNVWFNGSAVAAYRKIDGIQLRAVTTSGKFISKPINITNAEFEALKAEWREGSINHQDATVAVRALRHVGIDV